MRATCEIRAHASDPCNEGKGPYWAYYSAHVFLPILFGVCAGIISFYDFKLWGLQYCLGSWNLFRSRVEGLEVLGLGVCFGLGGC